MSHFVALCTEFVAWSEETANIMSDKDPAPEEVRHTSAFTMIEGQQQQPMFIGTQIMYPLLPVSTGSSINERVPRRVPILTLPGPCSMEH